MRVRVRVCVCVSVCVSVCIGLTTHLCLVNDDILPFQSAELGAIAHDILIRGHQHVKLLRLDLRY